MLGLRLFLLLLALGLGNFLFAFMSVSVDAGMALERTFFQGIALLCFYLTTFPIPPDNENE